MFNSFETKAVHFSTTWEKFHIIRLKCNVLSYQNLASASVLQFFAAINFFKTRPMNYFLAFERLPLRYYFECNSIREMYTYIQMYWTLNSKYKYGECERKRNQLTLLLWVQMIKGWLGGPFRMMQVKLRVEPLLKNTSGGPEISVWGSGIWEMTMNIIYHTVFCRCFE